MQFEVTSPGRLHGKISLPGDRVLTLALMAFGLFAGKSVSIRNPSPAPETDSMKRFLRNAGAELTDLSGGLALRGSTEGDEVELPPELPGDVFHILLSGAVFSRRRVIVDNPGGIRDDLLGMALPPLRMLGLRESDVASENERVSISGAGLAIPDKLTVSSAWELETAAAAAVAARQPITVSCNRQEIAHVLALLRLLGGSASGADERMDELTRRLARMSGEKPSDVLRLEWNLRDCEVHLPGDTVLAAALAGIAAVVPRSDITLKDVLWESGRRGFFEALRRMKGAVEWAPKRGGSLDAADIRVRGGRLEGIQTTLAQARSMHSELPLLGAVAAFARGETIIRDTASGDGVGRNVFKWVAEGLEMLGAHVGDYAEGIVVKGGVELKGNLLDSAGIPAVALALAMAGNASGGETVVFGFGADSYPVREFLRLTTDLASGVNRKSERGE